MKRIVMIFVLSSLFYHIGVNAQSLVYYEYTPTVQNKPDQLLRTVTAPCYLEPRPGNTGRLPLDSTFVSSRSSQSLLLKWKSAPTGDWIASLRWPGNTLYDVSQYDSLAFYLYSQDLTNSANLPYISFLTKNSAGVDVESTAIPMGDYVSNLPVGQWIEVNIPISAFLNAAGNPEDVNFAKLAQIRFKKGLADNVEHAINLDFIRINKRLNPPVVAKIKGYDAHVELFLKVPSTGSGDKHAIYRSDDGGNSYSFIAQVAKTDTFYMDWIGKATVQKDYFYRLVSINTANEEINSLPLEVTATVRPFTDNELMEMTLESTFRFYWDCAYTQTGLMPQSKGRYGWNQANVGNTGFMILAYIMGVNRGYITKEQAIERLQKTCSSFMNLKRTYGVIGIFDSYYTKDGKPEKMVDGNFYNKSAFGDGGMLAEGLLCARQFFSGNDDLEKNMRDSLTQVYESMDWSVHARPSNGLVYWSAYLDKVTGELKDDNFQAKAIMELMSGFYMGAASPTHPLPKNSYMASWANRASSGYVYDKSNFYTGQDLDVFTYPGSPLFSVQYYFFSVNPWNLTDGLCQDYGQTLRNFGLVHYAFSKEKSAVSKSFSDQSWGMNAASGPYGYIEGGFNDFDGTVGPYSALGSMPYTPVESKKALRHYYCDMGNKLYTQYGFYNSFNQDYINPDGSYFVEKDFSYSGITMVFLENYLTQFFWKLGEKDPVIQDGLAACGLYYKDGKKDKMGPEPASLKDGLIGWYKADSTTISGTPDDVTGWKDLSGKGHDLTKNGSGKVSLNKDVLNGNNTIKFSNLSQNSNNYFNAALGDGLKGDNVSAYIVAKIDNASANNSILMTVGKQGETQKESEDRDGAILFYAGISSSGSNANPKWGLMRTDTMGVKKSVMAQSSMTPGNGFSVHSSHFRDNMAVTNSNGGFDGKINQQTVTVGYNTVDDNGVERKIFDEGKSTFNLNFKKFDANELRVGGSAFTQKSYFIDAQVAEILLFDEDKYPMDKVISTYLAIKYGIEQSTENRGVWDYLRPDGAIIWDGSYAPGYKNGIAGIGRSDYMGLDQRQSACGTTGEEISFSTGSTFGEKSAFLNDESYLMWGNNKQAIDTFQVVSGFSDLSISKRVWRLSVSDLHGLPVSVSINLHSVINKIDTTKNVGILLADNPKFSDARFIEGTFKNDSLLINGIQFSKDSTYFMALGTVPVEDPSFTVTPPAAICAASNLDLTTTVSDISAGAIVKYYTTNDGTGSELIGNDLIVSPSVTTSYFVRASDPRGIRYSDFKEILVSVKNTPTATLSGPVNAVATQNLPYMAGSGSNYIWTINGGAITSGGAPGNATATVQWGATSPGQVKVRYEVDGCPTTEAVVSVTIVPQSTPVINNPETGVCVNTVHTYSTTSGKFNYVWTVTGGRITGGQGTANVMIAWDTAGQGTLKVRYSEISGSGAVESALNYITVYALPIITTTAPQPIRSGTSIDLTTTVNNPSDYTLSFYTTATGGTALSSYVVTPNVTTTYYVEAENANNCASVSRIPVTLSVTYPTGVDDVTSDQIKVYPNPTPGMLKISGTIANQTIRVVDITGSLKGNYRAQDGTTTIDLTSYAKGTYLLQYNGKTSKVIKN